MVPVMVESSVSWCKVRCDARRGRRDELRGVSSGESVTVRQSIKTSALLMKSVMCHGDFPRSQCPYRDAATGRSTRTGGLLTAGERQSGRKNLFHQLSVDLYLFCVRMR